MTKKIRDDRENELRKHVFILIPINFELFVYKLMLPAKNFNIKKSCL